MIIVIVAVVTLVVFLAGGALGFTLAEHMLPQWAERALKENRENRSVIRSLPTASVDTEDMVCGCEHHRAYHDPKTGKCSGVDRKRHPTYSTQFKDYPCTCKQYVGPVEKTPVRVERPSPDFFTFDHGRGDNS